MKQLNLKNALATLAVIFSSFAFTAKGQIITTVAGNGTQSYNGDGGEATSASLNQPAGVAVDTAGNIYIADRSNHVIRKVNTSGVISTVAGNSTGGYSGDGGTAINASLFYPSGVAVDIVGNIYIADWGNQRIRKVDVRGVISTVVGNGTKGYRGDGGTAINASLFYPSGVAVDTAGNIYIADDVNNVIRKVNNSGVIRTVAGNGTGSYNGDGDTATNANLYFPDGVAVDAVGNIYIADYGNHRIRKVNTSGIITTLAGNGNYGFIGDGGAATSANLDRPTGVAVDAEGSIYIAVDTFNRIRKVNTSGIISTVTGNGTRGYSGDGGAATSASLKGPNGVAVDATGNIYIADTYNNVIRKVISSPLPVTLASFTAIATNKVSINWQTATELNTSHFIIQHSTTGTSFTDIGNVKAIGSGANGYQFTDTHPANGTNYYRLQSVDKDGSSSFSKVVSVEFTVNRLPITVVPNPVRDVATIMGSHIASVQVIDNMGRVAKIVALHDATNPSISVGSLPAGVYHLRIQTVDGNVNSKAIVVSN